MQKYGEKYALTLVSAMEYRSLSVDLEDNKQRIQKIKTRGSPRSLCTSRTSDYIDGQPLVCENTCSRDWLLYMVRVILSGWYRRGAMIGDSVRCLPQHPPTCCEADYIWQLNCHGHNFRAIFTQK